MPGKRSMSQSYLRSLVTLATVPVMLLGYLWISEQHRRFEQQSDNWRSAYIQTQQQALRRRVADIIGSLDFERETLERRQRETLARALDNGVAQLDSVVRFAKSNQPREQLLSRARDLFAPIRFGSGRDHYFIYNDDGTALLLPAYPQAVGRDSKALRDANGVPFAAKMMQRARESGDAYLEVWYPQTDGHNGALLTMQYLHYYAPLNIFLGAAGYVDDMTQAMQREELARLATLAGQEDMVLRVSDSNNIVLLDTLNPELRGQHVPPGEGAGTATAIQVKKVIADADGGFVQLHRSRRQGTDAPQPILMYLRSYPGWHWNIGAGYFLDPLESTLAKQRVALQRDIERRVIEGALVVGLLAVVAVLIAAQLARRTRHALQNFTNFFADASRNATNIDVEQLPYTEFEQLARDANAMVDQRHKIEQALRMSEQRFEMTLLAAGSHLWDLNLRDDTIVIGGSLFKQLGYSSETRQIDMSEWSEWVHPDDLPALLQKNTDANRFSREFRMRAHDGKYYWMSSRGGEVDFDASGVATRALGTFTDVSARKQMEQELIAARIAAEDANHAKSQFLSSISHELRTPLNGVLGYAQILLRDNSASAEQRHNLRAIESCGQHLLTLIDDVLDLAKIESGKIEIQDDACDLYDSLESVSNIVRERVDAKGLSYQLDIAAQVPAIILIDEVKLRQILVNLLGNAVKFTEQGGVTLRVSLRDEATLLFQVQDTGMGIPLDRQQVIFEPFRQLGNPAVGTGLGLPISLRLCEAMGGGLSVQSAVGTGSCFSFYLPLRTAAAAGSERAQRPSYQLIDTGDRHVEVMVVDDNPINRQVLSGMLRASGVEVCEAEHGQDALDKLRLHPVPLVLMDVRMPVLDGFAATAAIKADPLLCNTIVIAVSASAFPDVIARMRAHGCADFVGKPVRVSELLSKVAEHLQLPLYAFEIPSRDSKTPVVPMPENVREELASAIALGDLEAMRNVLAPLYESSPQMLALARHIEQLLDDFDIEAVRELVTAQIPTA
jgi:signal transduction histidine kinase/ActR/RegA family two-component response regulator